MGGKFISGKIKERLYSQTSLVFLMMVVFYLVQAIFAVFSPISPPLFDFSAAILLLLFAFALHLSIGLKRTVPLFLAIGLFFNILGLYQIIPYNEYYTGTLYGAPQLNYHYDWIAHSVGFGFFALAFSSVMYPYLRKAFRNHYTIFVVLLLAMLGFGALNEINEYVGFTVFGYGKGFMEFGEGDFSPYEGPWQNSSMDLVNNLLGGIVFIGLFVLDKKYCFISGSRPRR